MYAQYLPMYKSVLHLVNNFKIEHNYIKMASLQ